MDDGNQDVKGQVDVRNLGGRVSFPQYHFDHGSRLGGRFYFQQPASYSRWCSHSSFCSGCSLGLSLLPIRRNSSTRPTRRDDNYQPFFVTTSARCSMYQEA
jgi:hypothetical protein